MRPATLCHLFAATFVPLLICCAEQESKHPPFRLGLIQSLTGIASIDGREIVDAARRAVEEINRDGNMKVELLVEDDGTDPKGAVTAYHKLQSQGIDAILGASWDFTTKPLIPLAERDHLTLLNTSTLREVFQEQGAQSYVISTGYSIAEEAKIFGEFAQKLGAKTVTILYATNLWGEIQREALHKRATELGLKIAGEFSTTSYDSNDWLALVPRLRAMDSDIIAMLVNKTDIEVLLKYLSAQKVRSKLFGSRALPHAFGTTNDRRIYSGSCYAEITVPGIGGAEKLQATKAYNGVRILYEAFQRSKLSSGVLTLRDRIREVLVDTTWKDKRLLNGDRTDPKLACYD